MCWWLTNKIFFDCELVEWPLICRDLYQHIWMGGPDATSDPWKQPFSAVRASGGCPGNGLIICRTSMRFVAYFCQITPYIWLNTTVGCGQSLGYSINARAFPLGHFIKLVVAWLVRYAHRGKHSFVKSFDSSFQSTTIVVSMFMCVLDKRNTLWLWDMVRQTSLGKSVTRVDLWSA